MQIGDEHRHLVSGELAQLLAAATTRRDGLRCVADHGHREYLSAARHHHVHQGGRFGAQALWVGRVLDIAAGVDAAGVVEHGGADGEVRVRRISAQARGACGIDQCVQLNFVHGVIHVQRSFTYGMPSARGA